MLKIQTRGSVPGALWSAQFEDVDNFKLGSSHAAHASVGRCKAFSSRPHKGSGVSRVPVLVAKTRQRSTNVFRTEVRHIGKPKRRIAMFAFRDDHALKIDLGKTRLRDANVDRAYWSALERKGVMFFDLTNLQGDAHSRTFEDITSAAGVIEQRFASGQDQPEGEAALISEQ
jgi:hypothetical protein